MNFAKFQRLVADRPGFLMMDQPTASGEFFSDSCGDMYTFYISVGPGEVLDDVSYFTTGCGFGTATSSIVVELAGGKTVGEAEAITEAQVEAELDGYPEKKRDYPERSLAALRAAIADYRAKRARGEITDAMLAENRTRVEARKRTAAVATPAATAEPLTIQLH